MKTNMLQKLTNLVSAAVSRASMYSKLGKSFGGDRELYVECGYPTVLEFSDYDNRFTRQDVAKRIVKAYPDATWKRSPEVYESDDKTDTDFEKAVKVLFKETKVLTYLRRADILAGIGRFGILLIGFDDGKALNTPVTSATKVIYLKPYSEGSVKISRWEEDKTNARYGLPTFYNITIQKGENASEASEVHYTRILHIADECLDSDIYGTPRLEAVYNRLQDLETELGGSAEMFWKGGFPGYSFKADADAEFDTDDETLKDEIEEYMQGLRRYVKLQGITATSMSQEIANPTPFVDVELKMISGATGIPVRILTGSERGELASSSDEDNWNSRVEERRTTFAEPYILRAFVDMMMAYGVLPKVAEYQVFWPDIAVKGEQEKANIAKTKTETLAAYIGTPGADMFLPPFQFMTMFLGMKDEEAQAIIDAMEEKLAEEQGEIEEDGEEVIPEDADEFVDDDSEYDWEAEIASADAELDEEGFPIATEEDISAGKLLSSNIHILGGPGSGVEGHTTEKEVKDKVDSLRSKKSPTGDSFEDSAARTQLIGEWAQITGETSAKVQAGIARGLKRGDTLGEAADKVYSRLEKQYRNALGDDSYVYPRFGVGKKAGMDK